MINKGKSIAKTTNQVKIRFAGWSVVNLIVYFPFENKKSRLRKDLSKMNCNE